MQSLGFRLAAKTLQIQHEAHTARETTGQKDESHEMRRYVEVISLDIRICCGRFVGPSHTANGWSPCSGKFLLSGGRVFCHSAHTRPSARGENLLFQPEDHAIGSSILMSTKISTASGRARNCTLRTRPLRRRGRKTSKMSKTCAAIEDRRKLQSCRAITVRNGRGLGEHLFDPDHVWMLYISK